MTSEEQVKARPAAAMLPIMPKHRTRLSNRPVPPPVRAEEPRCAYCHGTGVEQSARARWSDLRFTLESLMWPEPAIVALHDALEPDDLISSVRQGGVTLRKPNGDLREIARAPAL
jgi:hypothetical protein